MDGDGYGDFVFERNDGMLGVWFMRGAVRHGAAILDPAYAGEGWHPVAAGDMNQDGRADLIFKHTSGLIGVWLMNGAQLSSASLMQPNYLPSSWEIKTAGDFNQNGGCDLLLESTDRTLAMWFMNGLTDLPPFADRDFELAAWHNLLLLPPVPRIAQSSHVRFC